MCQEKSNPPSKTLSDKMVWVQKSWKASPTRILTAVKFPLDRGGGFTLKLLLRKGGEVHEMDVPPCNPLFDLWVDTLVLSMT